MMRASYSRQLVAVLFAGLCLPLMLGQSCFPPANNNNNNDDGGAGQPQPTVLFNGTQVAPTTITFNPTAAGKLITATVSGNVTGSRPRVQVLDNNNVVVANELFPTTSTTTVSFTSTTTGTHRLVFFEIGVPSSLYTITVDQAP